MKFQETDLRGAYLLDLEPLRDDRGFFARSWCRREFEDRGLVADFKQCNISYNKKKGSVRGMHFTLHDPGEAKVVRCTAGSIYDVLLDLRPSSPTHLRWIGVEITAANRRSIYVPPGVAHGFQTLADESEVFYLMSEYYSPDLSRGVRFDDPSFGIRWPLPVTTASPKDRSWPVFEP